MKVHHINCATICPPRLFADTHVCHCLVIETGAGLVLVDTGLGTRDLEAPSERLGGMFVSVLRPRLDPAETALAQITRLGFAAGDVRHVLLTHLDVDHAGGIGDFPDAEIHVGADELAAALAPSDANERQRYRGAHWAHGPRWQTHAAGGEPWRGFDGVRAVDGLPPEILLVPLAGHTRGHSGIAVQGPDGWMLHCGDAYFFRGEVATAPSCPAGLRIFQRVIAIDNEQRLANQARLRTLATDRAAGVRVFCAHDELELAQAQRAQSSPLRGTAQA